VAYTSIQKIDTHLNIEAGVRELKSNGGCVKILKDIKTKLSIKKGCKL